MKEKLIELYGDKLGLSYFEKYTEEELYELKLLEKELPEDPKWQNKIIELEERLKEKEKQLQEKDNHISKLNDENKNKRLTLENEKLTKEELQAKLVEVETKLNDYQAKFENYKDYDNYKSFYETKQKEEIEYKEALLNKLPEEYRDDFKDSKPEAIKRFLERDIPSETPGINNQQAPVDAFDSGLKSLLNAFKPN